MEWQETAFPVPVHAAAIMGDIIVDSRARIVVMDSTRRILQAHYTSIFAAKAIGNQVQGN
jgi:hypothetical protein